MSIRAEWRLNELMGVADDPFDSVVLSTGLTVDLTGTEEEIHEGLRRSLDLEAQLFNAGVTCELKDGGQDCLTCAMYVADRAEEPRAPLCRLGRDQRIMEIKANERSEARYGPFQELAASVEEFAEIGEIDAEYAELLTVAGL